MIRRVALLVAAMWCTALGQAEPVPFRVVETSVDEVHAAYKSGALTSRQLVQAYVDRIAMYDKKGPAINSIITINARALEEADALDAAFKRSKQFVGPMHGIPILVKDEIDTAGMPTTEGTLVFKDYRPTRDAFVVERLRKAGAIILGKTTLSEFAAGDTYGSLFGATRNPYDLERTAGGSSGGSGAALAANFSTLALGEETSASIRRPGAWNAVVSLRPTPGLVSRSGMWDGYPSPTAQMGPMARSVRDLAQLLDAMVGYDAEDPVTALGVGRAPDSYTTSLDPNGLKGARIGILRESIGGQSEPGSEDFKKVDIAFERNVAELRAAGAVVVDPIVIPGLKALLGKHARNPEVADEALRLYLSRNPNSPFKSREDIARSPGLAKSIPPSKATAWAGPRPATDLARWGEYLQAREQLLVNIAKVMADNTLTAIVHKSVEHQPTLITEGMYPPYTSGKGVPTLNTFLVFAASMTVPSGFTTDNLPVGITFFGLPYSEPALIKLAYAYEQATHHRVPPKTTPPLGPWGRPIIGAGNPVMLTRASIAGAALLAMAVGPQPIRIQSRPETVVWGEFPIDRAPVATVKPGEIVRIDTLSHQGTTQDQEPIAYLGSMGVSKEEVLQDAVDFWKSRSSRPREGRAGHVLTGPVYVEGAEPGDTLEVQILAYALRVPYGINAGNGVLGAAYPGTLKSDSVPEPGRTLIRTGTLDGKRVAFLAKGVVVPVRPFMGIMAVAPPDATTQAPGITVAGVANSRAPGTFGGNLDFKDLTAGTSLFLPVFHRGARFYVGDPHSAQGDGEVNGTALEHALTGTFRFVVHKDRKISYPQVETPTHYILMGIDVDLNRAMRIAVQHVVDFLVTEKHLTAVDALALASIGCDFHVAEAVDLTQIIVGKIPKSVFRPLPRK